MPATVSKVVTGAGAGSSQNHVGSPARPVGAGLTRMPAGVGGGGSRGAPAGGHQTDCGAVSLPNLSAAVTCAQTVSARVAAMVRTSGSALWLRLSGGPPATVTPGGEWPLPTAEEAAPG